MGVSDAGVGGSLVLAIISSFLPGLDLVYPPRLQLLLVGPQRMDLLQIGEIFVAGKIIGGCAPQTMGGLF